MELKGLQPWRNFWKSILSAAILGNATFSWIGSFESAATVFFISFVSFEIGSMAIDMMIQLRRSIRINNFKKLISETKEKSGK